MRDSKHSQLLMTSAFLMFVGGVLLGFCLNWYIGALLIISGLLLYIASINFKNAQEDFEKSEGVLETERLLLRPWDVSDAEELYKYASDPKVGPIAGWQPHKDAEDSKNIICTVLSDPETYAIVLKETGKPIGSIGLLFEGHGNMPLKPQEVEIGFWLGVPYWGKGLMTEATREILRHSFEDLEYTKVWCGYYNDNVRSKRVQEKCGFTYEYSQENHYCELMDDYRTMHLNSIMRDEWMRK